MIRIVEVLTKKYGLLILPGVELTYVPSKLIKFAADKCRKLGTKVIIVHGETIDESFPSETNMYAVKSDIDILAHPGHLFEEEADVAFRNNIKIEITTRKWHSATNKEVAEVAIKKMRSLY